ncbi:hypothetical protein A2533_00670 [Candidatus Falkowbacteria bacterium RIFOXYD2_FULL_35_9]|uniref:AB hydrolase-1 domain-containing protein n=1 Tax=Candidatus Falkowbacteria bacterium RIFOXYC2_FULL_36_12 TaxID=1798002 RepID=A0A1F5T0E2_9BACT|nr:MAG: hypothetical protein A2300_00040 [Candidatus Falkowbacteria bacterium RIFOXYB2_FULL_35_7]OGF32427.1 MAG: hypothetical protein A2478_03855 [Candidatus Falkowbacteria bacterium RIFOXYC2_FULL_36_12]OGF46776.1 MAG: hypothetical protein A2533_00670 [Candidatus Falkowbacteria bacterium RIFOXYD2_FULL_35_9]
MKPQILLIHGGTTFKTRKAYLDFLKNLKVSTEPRIRWRDGYLDKELGNKFEIIRPTMPLKENAQYEDWKIYFERYFPHIKSNVILIGTSLGGTFLAKYLSENKFPKKIKSVYLIAPPFDNTLPGEDLVNGFKLKSDLSMINTNCKHVELFFSSSDEVVPLTHAKKYRKKLPNSEIIILDNIKGHFQVSKFPELIKKIIQKK